MDEYRYVDNPFDDRDLSIEGADLHYVDICKKAFWSCGRRRNMFRSDAEAARWRRIDKGIRQGHIYADWIKNRLELAEKYRWGLPQLMSAILNAGKMEEWARKNHVASIIEEQDGPMVEDNRAG